MSLLTHPDGTVEVAEQADGKRTVRVTLTNRQLFMRQSEFTTSMTTTISMAIEKLAVPAQSSL